MSSSDPSAEMSQPACSPPDSRITSSQDSNDDMFSPTSAAALALSTLHHFGSDRNSRRSTDELKGTRLFQAATTTTASSVCNQGASPAQTAQPAPTRAAPTSFAPQPPPHPSLRYQAYPPDHHRYALWSQTQPSPNHGSTHPRQSPVHWGHPQYAYPPHPPQRSFSREGHTPSPMAPSPTHFPSGPSQTPCAHPTPYRHSADPRASPPVVGPSPPLTASNSFIPATHTAMEGAPEKHLARPASSSLVTPTPKKMKLESPNDAKKPKKCKESANASAYSRKKKSLGVLAENFLRNYQSLPQGAEIVVDEAAVQLGVERRRIYDVVNILESICLVSKKQKNTYSWMGLDHLDKVFGRLQAAAMKAYPDDARNLLGADVPPTTSTPPKQMSKSRENKSLAKLSQDFLQVFLMGHETLSLPEASDKIQGTTTMEELIALGHSKGADHSDPKELKAAAARGLKTKIRRLYDIANVFLSVGLLKKVDSSDSSRRPNFSWSYPLSAKEIYEQNQSLNDKTPLELRASPTSSLSTTTQSE